MVTFHDHFPRIFFFLALFHYYCSKMYYIQKVFDLNSLVMYKGISVKSSVTEIQMTTFKLWKLIILSLSCILKTFFKTFNLKNPEIF